MGEVVELPKKEVISIDEAIKRYLSDNNLSVEQVSCAHIILVTNEADVGSIHLGDIDPLLFIGILESLKGDVLDQLR